MRAIVMICLAASLPVAAFAQAIHFELTAKTTTTGIRGYCKKGSKELRFETKRPRQPSPFWWIQTGRTHEYAARITDENGKELQSISEGHRPEEWEVDPTAISPLTDLPMFRNPPYYELAHYCVPKIEALEIDHSLEVDRKWLLDLLKFFLKEETRPQSISPETMERWRREGRSPSTF